MNRPSPRQPAALFLAAGATIVLALLAPAAGAPAAPGANLKPPQQVQKWCGPGGRLCYDPKTTRWTWKKKKRH